MSRLNEDLYRLSNCLERYGFRDATFFVTGATGLVGSVLVKAILFANRNNMLNNRVVAFVRNIKKAEQVYTEYENDSNLFFCVGDVTNPMQYGGAVDYIIHAASETKSANMIKYPVETIWTTVAGSKNILDFAVSKKVKGVVYLSSMEVFGTPDEFYNRVREDEIGYIDLQNIRSCYPESKRLVENMCACYAAEHELPVITARLAQTFGAGVSKTENRVFAQFAKSIICRKDIILHTSGSSYGNYVYTADAVDAIFLLLKKGIHGQTYTVANEETTMCIKDMAELVASEIANGQIQVVYDISNNNKYGYAPEVKLKLSSEKLRNLGWNPQVNLRDAYCRMIDDWEADSNDLGNRSNI